MIFRIVPTVLFYIGFFKSKSKNFSGALRMYNAALKIYPKSGFLYLHKALAHLRLKNLEEALENSERSVQLSPAMYEAHNNKGVILMGLKRYEDALSSFDEAIKLKPGYALGYANKSEALSKLGRYDEAIHFSDIALQTMPNLTIAQLNKAFTLLKLDKISESSKICDSIKASEPMIKAYFEYLQASIAALKGSNDKALNLLKSAINNGFDDVDDIKQSKCWNSFQNNEEFSELLQQIEK